MILFQLVAKGKDASDLFPAVVKNVVSKNIEVCIRLVMLFQQTCATLSYFNAKNHLIQTASNTG